MLVVTGMSRVLLFLLFLVAVAHAADAVTPGSLPPPPLQDFTEYGVGQLLFLSVVALICSLVAAPICILIWALFVFLLVKLLGLFGIPPTALLMKLVQRQMMGKGKGLIWQLAILICLPAGVLGLWLAIWMFSLPYHAMNVVVFGAALGVVTAVGFVWLAKKVLAGLRERMGGGMGGLGAMGGMGGLGGLDPRQAQMLAQMMRMKDKE